MKKAGVKPNEVTYNTVINAHTQKGDPEGVSVPPMRMAGAQWGSALFSRHGMLAIAGFRPGGKAGWPNSPVARRGCSAFPIVALLAISAPGGGGTLLLQLAVDF